MVVKGQSIERGQTVINTGSFVNGFVAMLTILEKNNIELGEILKVSNSAKASFPAEYREKYEKQKLPQSLSFLSPEDESIILQYVKEGVKQSANIYYSLYQKQDYSALTNLSYLFGKNIEFGQYFFRELCKREKELPVIDCTSPGKHRSLLPLTRGSIVIGRNRSKQSSAVGLPDKGISTEHCRITSKNNEIIVEDLGSRNGCFLDERRVHGKMLLKDAAVIKMGNSEILLHIRNSNNIIGTFETKVPQIKIKRMQKIVWKVALVLFTLGFITAAFFYWSDQKQFVKTFAFWMKSATQTDVDKNSGDPKLAEAKIKVDPGKETDPQPVEKGMDPGKKTDPQPAEAKTGSKTEEASDPIEAKAEVDNKESKSPEPYKSETGSIVEANSKTKTNSKTESVPKNETASEDKSSLAEASEEVGKKIPSPIKLPAVADSSVSSSESKKFNTSKYPPISLSKAEKRRYVKKLSPRLKTYYAHLKNATTVVKNEPDILTAYYRFLKKVRPLEDFVGELHPDILKYVRSKSKTNRNLVYIYPLSLNEEYTNFSWKLNPSRMTFLAKEIVRLQNKFAKPIQQEKQLVRKIKKVEQRIVVLEKQKQASVERVKKYHQLENEIKAITSKIAKNKQLFQQLELDQKKYADEVAHLEQRIQRLINKINSFGGNSLRTEKQRLWDLEKNLKDQRYLISNIRKKIDEIRSKIYREKDPSKKKDLQDLLRDYEQQLKTAVQLEDSMEENYNSLQEQIRTKEKELEDLEEQLNDKKSEQRNKRSLLQETVKKKDETKLSITALNKAQANKTKTLGQMNLQQLQEKVKADKIAISKERETQQNLETKRISVQKIFAPLTQKLQKKSDIEDSQRKFQMWWDNVHREQQKFASGKEKVTYYRQNMILALYIMENFSGFYKTKSNKNFRRFTGIVEIRYW